MFGFTVRGQPTLSSPNPELIEKESLTLTCVSSPSIPQPVFRWIRDGVELRSSNFIDISSYHIQVEDGIYMSISNLTINQVELSDSGRYTCRLIQDDSALRVPLSSTANLLVRVDGKCTSCLSGLSR